MNGPGNHQHRGMGMQARYRNVGGVGGVGGGGGGSGSTTGPMNRSAPSSHTRSGWHPLNQHANQHTQHNQQQQYKEYPYRQGSSSRYHNGYPFIHLKYIYSSYMYFQKSLKHIIVILLSYMKQK